MTTVKTIIFVIMEVINNISFKKKFVKKKWDSFCPPEGAMFTQILQLITFIIIISIIYNGNSSFLNTQ